MSPVTANVATDTALAESSAERSSLRVVLVGPPGAGKGTQAKVIAAQLGVPSVATGDIFRASARQDTPLGRQAREIMGAGALMPDDLTIDLVRDRLAQPDACAGFLLDGFPRTLKQAAALDEFLGATGRCIDAALSLALDEGEVIRRLSGRRTCHGCKPPRIWHLELKPPVTPGICDDCGGELYLRDDDAPATVRARLTEYAHSTAPLIDFYQTQGKLAAIDAVGPVEDITRRAMDALRSYSTSAR